MTTTTICGGPRWLAGLALTLLPVGPGGPNPTFGAILDEDDEESADADEDEDAEDRPEWFAVVGGDVHTGTGSVLRGATVVSKDGEIVAIGYDPWFPEDAGTLDATGYHVYPGLVAINSFGLFGGGSDLENSVNPFNRNMILALAAGITTAFSGGEIEDVVIGTNPFTDLTYGTGNPSAKRSTREKLEKAADYLRRYHQWEIDKRSDDDLKEPSKKDVDESYVKVLRGQTRAAFSASSRTDLLEIARLAQRFGFRPLIRGCREGWVVADELGRAGASAIVTPRDRRPKDETLVREGGSSIENAALLHAAGVSITILPSSQGISLGGIVGRDLMHLPVEAGFAIRGGLPEDAALRGITIEPARLLGVDHRIGTLEVGKDADMIVTDGDVLHYQTFVQWAVVDGKLVYDKQAELYFAHIRPRPESSLAPLERVDAGESPPETEADDLEEGEDDGGDGDPEDPGEDDGSEDGGDGPR